MIVVKSNTKRGQNLLASATNNKGKFLEDIYKKPSENKIIAWNNIYKQCLCEYGKDFHITANSCHKFSVSWNVKDGVRYVTADNSYLIKTGIE